MTTYFCTCFFTRCYCHAVKLEMTYQYHILCCISHYPHPRSQATWAMYENNHWRAVYKLYTMNLYILHTQILYSKGQTGDLWEKFIYFPTISIRTSICIGFLGDEWYQQWNYTWIFWKDFQTCMQFRQNTDGMNSYYTDIYWMFSQYGVHHFSSNIWPSKAKS